MTSKTEITAQSKRGSVVATGNTARPTGAVVQPTGSLVQPMADTVLVPTSDVCVVFDSASHDTLALTHQIVRGWHLLVVRGNATVEGGSPFIAMLDAAVAAGARRLIVDLARVRAIGAHTITTIALSDRALRAANGELRLVVDGVAVLQAIREAGLSGRFEIHRYVGDIVGAVAGLDERGRGKRRGAF
jgi:anti-anti-sigma regulatory factor